MRWFAPGALLIVGLACALPAGTWKTMLVYRHGASGGARQIYVKDVRIAPKP